MTDRTPMQEAVRTLLSGVGEDPDREGLARTPERVEKALRYLNRGYGEDPDALIGEALFSVKYDEMVIIKDIDVFSLCEHHLLPFFGKAHVAYLPNGKVVGLSKIPRLVDMFARRLQVQERLTVQIARTIQEKIQPRGVGVVIEAMHFCMIMRGVEKQNSVATTSCMLGDFRERQATREEFLGLIRGRTRPGVCYRLYSRQDYEHRPLYTTEEILRTDLSEVVLRMAEINIKDFENFEFLSPPEPAGIIGAVETLRLLGALDENRDLTEVGRMMTLFPLSPRHSRIIVEAIHRYPRVLDEILTATAFLTTNSPFLLPQGQEMEARKAHHSFRHALGDFISYLNMYKAYHEARDRERFCSGYYLDKKVMDEILNVKQQLAEIVSEQHIPILGGGDYGDYLAAVARGHIQFVAVRAGRGLYHTLTAAKIQIHPSSALWGKEPEYIVAGEIVRTTRLYARSVSLLREEWLRKVSPTLLGDLRARKSGRKTPIRGESTQRDFTNQIKIGSETFKVTLIKNRKVVSIPADKLKYLEEKAPPDYIASLRDLRGEIQFEKYLLLHGARLPNVISLAPHIDLSKGVLTQWPVKRNFNLPHNKRELIRTLDLLLRPARRKKHEKHLGFLCLNSDGKGTYWFTAEKNFTNAVSTSLSGLESLADEPEGNLDHDSIAHVNRLYRRLDGMIGK